MQRYGMDFEYRPELVVNAEKRIIAILDHFRINRARYGE